VFAEVHTTASEPRYMTIPPLRFVVVDAQVVQPTVGQVRSLCAASALQLRMTRRSARVLGVVDLVPC